VPTYLDVPASIVARVRAACAHLPETDEVPTFGGVAWRVRRTTVAHLVSVEHEQAPLTLVTFHSSGEEHDALLAIGDPFLPGWGAGLIAMVLREDGSTDWEEVRELLTESYRLAAPKKLIAQLESPRRSGS
jgi:predicted DNA-binding protein (MmcQ/YjbR family)